MASIAGVLRSQGQSLFTQAAKMATSAVSGKTVVFLPTTEVILKEYGIFATERLKREPILSFSNMKDSFDNAGPITRYFLEKILLNDYDYQCSTPTIKQRVFVSSKIQYLSKGAYASNPAGWERSSTHFSVGMPGYWMNGPFDRGYIVHFSDHSEGVSHKEYLKDRVALRVPEKEGDLSVHEQMTMLGESFRRCTINDGEIVRMDGYSLCRERPAHESGWRGTLLVAILRDDP